jgi:hypothetical protein
MALAVQSSGRRHPPLKYQGTRRGEAACGPANRSLLSARPTIRPAALKLNLSAQPAPAGSFFRGRRPPAPRQLPHLE